MAGGVFCGLTCDWKLPQRYFGERNEYNELMSAEIRVPPAPRMVLVGPHTRATHFTTPYAALGTAPLLAVG